MGHGRCISIISAALKCRVKEKDDEERRRNERRVNEVSGEDRVIGSNHHLPGSLKLHGETTADSKRSRT